MRTATPILIAFAVIVAIAGPARAEIAWRDNLRAAHAEAQADGKLLLLHFYTDDCHWCDKLEEGAFQARQVGDAVNEQFVPLKVNAADNPKLTKMFQVDRFPTDVVVTTAGQMRSHSVSPQDPQRYVAMLAETLPQAAGERGGPDAKVASAAATADVGSPVPEPKTGPGSPQANQAAQPSPPASGGGLTLPSRTAGATPGTLVGARDEALKLEMPVSGGQPSRNHHVAAPPNEGGQDTSAEASIAAGAAAGVDAAADSTPPSDDSNKTLAENKALDETDAAADQAQTVEGTRTVEDPELALQGFCPVTVVDDNAWVEGNPDHGVVHLGKLYLFASREKMQAFLADPVPYTPVLNGIDVVRFFEERRIVPGKREWGMRDPIHNRMFFFADEAAMTHFENKYDLYTDAAIEVMNQAVEDSNPGS